MIKISWVHNEEDFYIEFENVHKSIDFVIDLMLYASFNDINIEIKFI